MPTPTDSNFFQLFFAIVVIFILFNFVGNRQDDYFRQQQNCQHAQDSLQTIIDYRTYQRDSIFELHQQCDSEVYRVQRILGIDTTKRTCYAITKF